MNLIRVPFLSSALIFAVAARPQDTNSAAASRAPQALQLPAPRLVELKAADGTILKASYFAAAKSGPGVLLLHQSNRTRDSWDGVARQLAAAGINTLTLDMRGFGESGGTPSTKLTDAERAKVRAMRPGDVDTAFQYLVSQPGLKRDVIGVGGAGEFGVGRSVEVARQHSAEVKSLALLSGDPPRRPAIPAAGVTTARTVRRGRRRRIPSHGRGDGIALHHRLQPGQEVRTLLCVERRALDMV